MKLKLMMLFVVTSLSAADVYNSEVSKNVALTIKQEYKDCISNKLLKKSDCDSKYMLDMTNLKKLDSSLSVDKKAKIDPKAAVKVDPLEAELPTNPAATAEDANPLDSNLTRPKHIKKDLRRNKKIDACLVKSTCIDDSRNCFPDKK
jgi:hypothetical protein